MMKCIIYIQCSLSGNRQKDMFELDVSSGSGRLRGNVEPFTEDYLHVWVVGARLVSMALWLPAAVAVDELC